MSPTSDHRTRRSRCAGFTFIELMIAATLSLVVVSATLSAYIFVGRNLTRLVNFQHQEVESRRALRQLTQDLSAAIQLSSVTSSGLTLTKPISGGTTSVSYAYDSGAGTLSRNGATPPLLSGLTAFTITYYNEGGTAVTSSPQSVKSVEFSFTSTAGSTSGATLARYSTVSPRIVLRNKQVLQ